MTSALRRYPRHCLAAIVLLLGMFILACGGTPDQTEFMDDIDNVEITAAELRLRLYDFANNFTGAVESTAAVIALEAQDPTITRRSLQWRLGASTAVYQSAFMQDPLGAFLDVWAFSKQMRMFLNTGAGSAYFGEWQSLAVATAQQLEIQAHELARYSSETSDVAWIDGQLEDWAQQHPLQDLRFIRESTIPQWAKLAAKSGGGTFATVGRMEVTLQDLITRLDIMGYQMQKRLRWEIELLRDESLAANEVAGFLDEFGVITEEVRLVRLVMEDVEPILDRIVAALFDSLDAFAAREKADMRASWPQERDILLAELEVLRQTVYRDLETASAATLREIDALSLRLATDADSPPRQLIDHMIWRLAQLLGAGLLVLMLLAAGAWWLWRRQSVERSGGR